MKQRKWKKRGLSWLLAFSLATSLFTGQIFTKSEAEAAGNAQITLHELEKSEDGTYYTYPDATVDYNGNKVFQYLTVSVDSGHLQVTSTDINGTTGRGIVSGNDMNVGFEDLTTTEKYEAISFELEDGASTEDIEDFIRTIQFTTANQNQTVSMHATTESSGDLKITINEKDVYLYYFNGHYYGYVPFASNDRSWAEAYRESKTTNFCGVNGYLATLTSRAEDRFILESFKLPYGNNLAQMGWIGCTRAKLAAGSDYSDPNTSWQPLDTFDFATNQDNFIWRWVSGPEAGDRLGYQSHAYGDGTYGDGGFVTDKGKFSNWNKDGNIEPNGGANTREAFGYYGKYEYGRWNDAENSGQSHSIYGYYIEFGGAEGDEERFAQELEQVVVSTTQDSGDIITDGSYTDQGNQKITGNPVIKNQNTDADKNEINEVGTVLSADITEITPNDSQDSLTYQWYIKNGDTLTPIDGATSQNYTLTADTLNKELVVKVTGTGDYTGEVQSEPYNTASSVSETIAITGKPVIKNETTDDNGYEIKKEGTILSASITNITPVGCHDILTYQWYIKEENGTLTPIDGAVNKNYILTADTLNKELVVKASGNEKYVGIVESDPYDTTRTNSGIDIGDNENTELPADKRIITIYPTVEDTIYAIKDENGNVYGAGDLSALPAVDGDGNALTPNVDDFDYEGYYQVEPGGKIVFTVDKDKNYIIHEVKKTTTNTEVISPTIPDSNIKTEYDTKNTTDTADDTISIIIDPADSNYKYAVLKKVDGKYVEVTVTKDANGNYALDSSSKNGWSDGGESKVTFTGLPADGTYRVVSVSASDSIDAVLKDLTPDQIIGGSKEITVTPPAVTPTPSPTAPANGQQSGNTVYTAEETDTAAQFVKEHVTDPKGQIITTITDITRDIITSGETEWEKLTDIEKAAVNAKLQESGCPYTYEQLLKKAKNYKIPGFKLRKVMRKNTKAKLKLIKCKGATIVCTSTNKKVATVNKKGVISAKKVGKATLTFTATKGKYTNRLVVNIIVRKKFKNAKELKTMNAKAIKTPTVLIAKKRLLKKSTKIKIYDLKKGSKVSFKAYNKKVLKITKKGKYTGKKKGSSLVRVKINQNKKVYLLYVYVSIFKK